MRQRGHWFPLGRHDSRAARLASDNPPDVLDGVEFLFMICF